MMPASPVFPATAVPVCRPGGSPPVPDVFGVRVWGLKGFGLAGHIARRSGSRGCKPPGQHAKQGGVRTDRGASPLFGQVGLRIARFEASSTFTARCGPHASWPPRAARRIGVLQPK